MNPSQKKLSLILSVSAICAVSLHFYLSKKSKSESRLNSLLAHKDTRIPQTNRPLQEIYQEGKQEFAQRNFNQALIAFEKALRMDPDNLQFLFDKGTTLMELGRPQDAFVTFNKILQMQPSSNMYVTAGKALERQNKPREALKLYEKAIELDPNNHHAHVSIAGMCWILGDLKRGFKEYEWRWVGSNMQHLQRWDGSDPAHKTVYLMGEAGIGDNIQFIRFARELKKKGARVILQVPPCLQKVAHQCDYIDEVVIPGQRPQLPFDAVTSIQSLATLIDIDIETLPNDPYLFADEKVTAMWQHKLAKDKNFKIGICWMPGGNIAGHVPQGQRHVPLKLFAPLAEIPGVTFYSLQKLVGLDELKHLPAHFKVVEFGPDFDETRGGFVDTAAVMKNMDLIITVDTSVAHFAGALGVPTWTLLPYHPDPRWMLERSDSPWYPSMKLFRCPEPYAWREAMAQVKSELTQVVKKKVNA